MCNRDRGGRRPGDRERDEFILMCGDYWGQEHVLGTSKWIEQNKSKSKGVRKWRIHRVPLIETRGKETQNAEWKTGKTIWCEGERERVTGNTTPDSTCMCTYRNNRYVCVHIETIDTHCGSLRKRWQNTVPSLERPTEIHAVKYTNEK